MNKELKITPPKGYEIDREKSTFEHIVFKEVSKKFPSKWEDLPILKGWFISSRSEILEIKNADIIQINKSTWPTQELAESALALSQLMQLRQAWIGDWKPDFNDYSSKYTIFYNYVVNSFTSEEWQRFKHCPSIPFMEDEQTAETIINEFHDELKLIFDID